MADWRDVMEARSEADSARSDVDTYAGQVENGREGDLGIMLALNGRAVCLELRALGMIIDYASVER